MASDTFYPFARLPAELQDQIWDFAVGSLKSHPSAHFFTFINKYEDMIPITAGKTLGLKTDGIYLLGPPQSGGLTKLSWTEANLSGYMSEITMDSKTSEDADELPILVGSLENVSDQDTTIDPKADLICLQPLDFNTIEWAEVIHPNPTILGTHINNLAFEFDPTRDSALLNKPIPHYEDTGPLRSVAEAASHNVQGWCKVWFIDYRIRWRIACTPNVTRKSFNANGCRFVEVLPFDEFWEDPCDPEPDTFRFLENLDTSLDDYYDAAICPKGRDSPDYFRFRTLVGVLAYEKFSH